MTGKSWWYISAGSSMMGARYIGKCEATFAEIGEAVGPYHCREGNHILVFAPKPKARRK